MSVNGGPRLATSRCTATTPRSSSRATDCPGSWRRRSRWPLPDAAEVSEWTQPRQHATVETAVPSMPPFRAALLILLLSLLARPAAAGPPFVSDDPEPTDYKH